MNTLLNTQMLPFLFSILLKSIFLFSISGILLILLRNRSSISRNYIYRLSLLAVLVLPLLEYFSQKWEVSQLHLPVNSIFTLTNAMEVQSMVAGNNVEGTITYIDIFLFIWLAGTIIMLLRILLGWILSQKIARESSLIIDNKFEQIKNQIEKNMHIQRTIQYSTSQNISSPIAMGWFKHHIIFPAYTQHWSDDSIKMILIHELAHIKRKDTIWLFISSITSALYWINPLSWIIRKNFIFETEKICDDYVLLNGADATSYAENLITIVKNINQKHLTYLAGSNMARKSELEGRLLAILNTNKRTVKHNSSLTKLMIIFTIIIVIPLAGLQIFASGTNSQLSLAPLNVASNKSDDTQIDEKQPKPDEFVPLTVMPEMIKSANPEYPKDAKKKGIEGVVNIKVLILKDGTVKKALVHKSSGNQQLDDSALKAAYKNIFSPGMQDDRAVACWVSYNVKFELDSAQPAK